MFGRIFGAILGYLLTGGKFWGAILGFIIGSFLDRSARIQVRTSTGRTTAEDFSASLLLLSAAVMKSDGKVMKSELDYVRKFYTEQFGFDYAQKQMLELRELLKQDIALREVCQEIQNHMDYHLRLQLLHYLFGLAKSDDTLSNQEMDTIHQISQFMGINFKDYESLKAMFMFGGYGGSYSSGDSSSGGGARPRSTGMDLASAYTILETESSVSDDELKKAYRKMAIKYHPDKVASLGEAHVKSATEKFQKVQQAYDTVCASRGIK
ncbi:MAG: DnaJ domain-containing protein [Bacteroidetes bacterium]|nr:DnaJ domain-containing protein [Bacteroidota bacterium]